jgi:hypothetical protein
MFSTRRDVLCGAACCVGGLYAGTAGWSQPADAAADEDDAFICGTIEDFSQSTLEIEDFGAGESELAFRERVAEEFSITDFGTAVFNLRWRPADGLTPNTRVVTLGCAFLSGNARQRAEVQDAANQWLRGGVEQLVRFDFTVPPERAQVRIFIGNQGNWTQPGRSALGITDRAQPTCRLNASFFNPLSRKAVLHEFGHVLGMRHEHLNPGFSVPFNEAVVVDEMHRKEGWTTAQTHQFILTRFGTEGKCVGDPDMNPASIMMYDIPARWTLNGASFAMPDTIHQRDLQCVHGLYSRA